MKQEWKILRVSKEVFKALADLADKKCNDTPDTVLRTILRLPERENTRKLVFESNLAENRSRTKRKVK